MIIKRGVLTGIMRSVLPGDIAALFFAGLLCAVSVVFVYGRPTAAAVLIEGKSGRWLYPIDAATVVTVQGPLGVTVVEIENGMARFAASPCKNQTCVAMGAVHTRGQWLACLPNAVLLTVEAGGAAAKRGSTAKQEAPDAGTW